MNDTITVEPFEDERIGWTTQRVLGAAVAVAIAAFWVWGFSPWAPSSKADGIRDKMFLADAKRSCTTMQNSLEALPPARTAASATSRSDVVAQSAPIFAAMIGDLRVSAASLQGRDAVLASQWIDDWQAYARDRQAYAVALRTDDRALFTVTRRESGQITVTMDGFSRVNDLASCLVPQDV